MIGEKEGSASQKQWPDALDAMIAAPAHHEVLLENDRVRVLDTRHCVNRAWSLHVIYDC
jgi:hypothetical protein